MATNVIINTGKILTILLLSLVKSGRIDLWSNLRSGLSKAKMSAGKIVTLPITPRITPLAITIPKSMPSVKVIKHSAMKPATVVADEPNTELSVALMACSMAWSGLLLVARCSRYECQRKIE